MDLDALLNVRRRLGDGVSRSEAGGMMVMSVAVVCCCAQSTRDIFNSVVVGRPQGQCVSTWALF